MLDILDTRVTYSRSLINEARDLYYELAQLYINNIKDEALLFEILKDFDIKGRKVIFIIYENSYLELIQG
jgi:hypothetical protein